jgi:tRNA U54 and U55 pseudouridine synthase Pus10
MDNFCRACGKSIPGYPDDDLGYEISEKDHLCPSCFNEFEKYVKNADKAYLSFEEVCFATFCLVKKDEKLHTTLEKVLDEKADLFMENLKLKEEIRQLLQGKGDDVLNTLMEKMEQLSEGYKSLNERTKMMVPIG